MAKGYDQIEGLDYNETFSPVVRMATMRLLFAISAILDLEVQQMDVKTAFLNGDLNEVIYMKQPQGFIHKETENLVCLLGKSIYGLKQSPRMWNENIKSFLFKLGFVRSIKDNGLYTLQKGEIFVWLALFIDDCFLFSNNTNLLKKVKIALSNKYDMTDMGDLSSGLNLFITRDRDKKVLTLSQAKYIEKKLQQFNMSYAKPMSTPLEVNCKLECVKDISQEEEEMMKTIPYKSAVGALMYLAITSRPDISYAVSMMAQYNSMPRENHWSCVKRILRYLNGTINEGLIYEGDTSLEVVGFCDADWAGDSIKRKSRSGYIFILGNGPISWNSVKQTCIAQSSAEAEYYAGGEATTEAIWIRHILEEMGFPQRSPTKIYCDSQS